MYLSIIVTSTRQIAIIIYLSIDGISLNDMPRVVANGSFPLL